MTTSIGLSSRLSRTLSRVLDEVCRRELGDLVDRGMEVAALVGEARRHGLVPLLRRHIQAIGPEACRPGLLDDLRTEAQAITVASLAAAAELVTIV